MNPVDSTVFLRHLPEPLRGQASRCLNLPALLAETVRSAQNAWPGLSLSTEQFLAFVAERLPDDVPLERAFLDLRAADLFLVAACLAGETKAIRAFEARYFGDVASTVTRISRGSLLADDILALLRQRLFVADSNGRPKLRTYGGRGDLQKWVQVIVVRFVLDVLKRERHLPVEDDLLLAIPAIEANPELELFKRHYRAEFVGAFAAAAAVLTPRERNLLRYAYVEGHGIDRLAAFFRVHRATAARWLERARQSLVDGIRGELKERLSVGTTELDSILRLIQSNLQVTLRRYFEAPPTRRETRSLRARTVKPRFEE